MVSAFGMSFPVAVIPARYASTRFPGKPLALISGRPMILHVAARCREAGCFSDVIVATDDQRIADVAQAAQVTVVMTSATCRSGTDRVAEVARARSPAPHDVFINVQGDEPALHPDSLRRLVAAFDDAQVEMATLVRALDEKDRANANVVKAVLAENGDALYFSRADLPFAREAGPLRRWAHVGLYGYRAATLERLATLPPTALEQVESLEQLRALGHGIRIACRETPHPSQSVDVPADVAPAEAALAALG